MKDKDDVLPFPHVKCKSGLVAQRQHIDHELYEHKENVGHVGLHKFSSGFSKKGRF